MSRRRVLGLLGGAAALGVVGCSDSDSDADADPPSSSSSSDPDVPEPAGFVRTRWADDPWALGAYSYLPVGATPSLRLALAEPIDGRLHLAGEATSPEAPATVHGARVAGRLAAELALDPLPDGGTVLVIGAGAAGAAAARFVVDTRPDLEVVVVEARDRTGGRIATTTPDGWPIPAELGASFVHDVAAS